MTIENRQAIATAILPAASRYYGAEEPTVGKRTKVGGKTIRIGGKVIKIGNN